MPQPLPQIQLQDVVYQQQDATVFNGAAIPAIAAAPEAFIIFYLTQADEQNGYGTVIQLDSETKQAAIFADLNPEYSHLFYNDEQQQLQTLLWCIEFATRNADGLFITHAKVYGKGITEAELRYMLSKPQANQQHQLTEEAELTAAPAPATAPSPTSAAPSTATTNDANVAPATTPATDYAHQAQTPPAAPPLPNVTTNTPQSNVAPPPGNQTPLSGGATPQASQQPPQPAWQPATNSWGQPTASPASQPAATPPAGQPDLLAMEQSLSQTPELNLPPMPSAAPPAPAASFNQSQPATANPTSAAAQPSQTFEPVSEPAPSLGPEPSLPQAPNNATAPTQWSVPSAPANTFAGPSQPAQAQAPSPAPTPTPSAPDLNLPPLPDMTAKRSNDSSVSRQPVGRPQKPLMQDKLWSISSQDFTWLKSISRQPIEQHREQLRQKAIQQLSRNKPQLLEDVQFQSLFEQAFNAMCITYDLVPGLRHDLLKAMLNGRMVEGIQKARQ